MHCPAAIARIIVDELRRLVQIELFRPTGSEIRYDKRIQFTCLTIVRLREAGGKGAAPRSGLTFPPNMRKRAPFGAFFCAYATGLFAGHSRICSCSLIELDPSHLTSINLREAPRELVLSLNPVTVPQGGLAPARKAFLEAGFEAMFNSDRGRRATRSPMANLKFIFAGVVIKFDKFQSLS